ncbi:MAG: hypothetical protein ACI8YQ_003070 [Polaribacter sp.]|jgi:hypothetical protein
MKNSISTLVAIIFISIGCNQQSNKENCHLKATENKLRIEFNNGDARNIMFSPFEKDKVFIGLRNSKNSMIEFDLTTKDTQELKHSDWKKIYSNKTPIYQDNRDSTVWVGGPNRKLLKYNQKLEKAEYLRVKYVTRIVPYESKIYFVAFRGLYVKGRDSDELQKVNGIPLEVIQSSLLLDEKTLILDSKITYDLKTDTWKEGIHLYNKKHKGEFYSIKAKNGTGIYQESGKLFYSTASDVKELKINNRLGTGTIEIDYPYIYGKGKKYIDRYNIQTEDLVSFEYRLPKVNNYRPNFRYDDDIIWIFRPGQLYFINTITKESYNFPVHESEQFKSMIYDDCHIYLLYEKRLEVMRKTEFVENCPTFNIVNYLNEFREYKNFIDSIEIRKEENENNVLQKLKSIKERYVDSTHPEILKQIESLNSTAFQRVKYETITDFEKCYKNERLPKEQRIRCFQTVIRKEVLQSNYVKVLKHEEDFKSLFEINELESMSYFQSNIDSIRNYLSYHDSIGIANVSADSLDYYMAKALKKICNTSFFCHEGCGGCDYSLVINSLRKFNVEYPNSLLIDNSELALIEYKYMYEEDSEPQELIKDFELFKNKFPGSDVLKEADFRILSQLFYSYNEKTKIGLIGKLDFYINSYPNDIRIEQINQWINELKR